MLRVQGGAGRCRALLQRVDRGECVNAIDASDLAIPINCRLLDLRARYMHGQFKLVPEREHCEHSCQHTLRAST